MTARAFGASAPRLGTRTPLPSLTESARELRTEESPHSRQSTGTSRPARISSPSVAGCPSYGFDIPADDRILAGSAPASAL